MPLALLTLQRRWRSLLIPVALVVILFIVASLADEGSTAFLLGRAPQDVWAYPNARALVHQIVLQAAALVAAVAGMLVSVSLWETQRAPRTWTLPSWHRAVRRDLLIILASLLGTLGLWSLRWAELSSIVPALLLVPWWLGFFASCGHLAARFTARPWTGMVSFVALLVLAIQPAAYTAVVRTIGWAGAVLLAAAGMALLWIVTTPTLHRAVNLLQPAAMSADDAALPNHGAPAPTTLIGWFKWLGNEVDVFNIWRTVGMHPRLLHQVFNGPLFAPLIYFSSSDLALIGMSDWNSVPTAGRTLWYPLSRRQRANLHFLDQFISLVMLAIVTSLAYWMLSASGAPRLPWFTERQSENAMPLAVTVASVFALFPIAQLPRAFAPLFVGAQAYNPFHGRALLHKVGAYMAFAILTKLLERGVWRSTHHDLLMSLALCALVAAALQAASYVMLRAVFARRDLTAALP